MKPFRIKDKLTGLYYCPSREIKIKNPTTGYTRYIKSNLSKKGKIYFTNPIKHISIISDHTCPNWSGGDYYPQPLNRRVNENSFEIEYL